MQPVTSYCFPLRHLVRQIHHAQVCLYFEAEGGEAGDAILWSGELMKDDGILRVQLLFLPTQRAQSKPLINVSVYSFTFNPTFTEMEQDLPEKDYSINVNLENTKP